MFVTLIVLKYKRNTGIVTISMEIPISVDQIIPVFLHLLNFKKSESLCKFKTNNAHLSSEENK